QEPNRFAASNRPAREQKQVAIKLWVRVAWNKTRNAKADGRRERRAERIGAQTLKGLVHSNRRYFVPPSHTSYPHKIIEKTAPMSAPTDPFRMTIPAGTGGFGWRELMPY